nr:oligosaccharide flippase family protein [Phyllobacterium myrsinacearum]
MAILEQYSQVIVSIAMITVLSRLLDSNEIGIAVIGLGIGTIALTFREFVTAEYLIQRETLTAQDVRTSFTLTFGFSMIIGCFLFFSSPFLSSFYGQSQLVTFIKILAFAGVVDSVVCPIVALLRRDLTFGAVTRINAIGSITNAVVTIIFVTLGFGYMGFAWGTLASAIVRVLFAFHAKPIFWMLKPCLTSWRSAFAFGSYKGASTLLDRSYEALPQLVLGRIMPLAAVGLYNRANLVCGLPDKVLLSAIFSVAFPAFAAEVRANRNVKKAYLRIISYITVLYWPAALVMTILAYPIVHVALGPSWTSAAPLVQIFSLAALFWFPNILTFPVLVAMGANREAFEANFIGRGLSMFVICTASFFGLYALAGSQFIVLPFQMYLSLIYVKRHVPFAWSELFHVLYRSGLITAWGIAGPLIVLAVNGFQFDLSIMQACIAGCLSAIGWLAGLFILKHPFLDELEGLARIAMFALVARKSSVAIK